MGSAQQKSSPENRHGHHSSIIDGLKEFGKEYSETIFSNSLESHKEHNSNSPESSNGLHNSLLKTSPKSHNEYRSNPFSQFGYQTFSDSPRSPCMLIKN